MLACRDTAVTGLHLLMESVQHLRPLELIGGAKAATFKMNYAAAKAAIDGATPTYNEQYGEATYNYTQSYNGVSGNWSSNCLHCESKLFGIKMLEASLLEWL